jgi:hypothetical protein
MPWPWEAKSIEVPVTALYVRLPVASPSLPPKLKLAVPAAVSIVVEENRFPLSAAE